MKATTYAFVIAIVFSLASFSAYNVGEVDLAMSLMFLAVSGAGFLVANVFITFWEWLNSK